MSADTAVILLMGLLAILFAGIYLLTVFRPRKLTADQKHQIERRIAEDLALRAEGKQKAIQDAIRDFFNPGGPRFWR